MASYRIEPAPVNIGLVYKDELYDILILFFGFKGNSGRDFTKPRAGKYKSAQREPQSKSKRNWIFLQGCLHLRCRQMRSPTGRLVLQLVLIHLVYPPLAIVQLHLKDTQVSSVWEISPSITSRVSPQHTLWPKWKNEQELLESGSQNR
jgi:hypothetical protein